MGRIAALHMAGQADALGGGLTLEVRAPSPVPPPWHARPHTHTCTQLFSHVTHMFGHKVVLVGRFNAQGLGPSAEAVARVRAATLLPGDARTRTH